MINFILLKHKKCIQNQFPITFVIYIIVKILQLFDYTVEYDSFGNPDYKINKVRNIVI